MDLEGIDVRRSCSRAAPARSGRGSTASSRIALCRTLNDARAEFTRYDAEAPQVGRQAADDRPGGRRRRAPARGQRARHGRHGHAAAHPRQEPRPSRASTSSGARRRSSASRSACTAAARRSIRCRSASTASRRASRSTRFTHPRRPDDRRQWRSPSAASCTASRSSASASWKRASAGCRSGSSGSTSTGS